MTTLSETKTKELREWAKHDRHREATYCLLYLFRVFFPKIPTWKTLRFYQMDDYLIKHRFPIIRKQMERL